MTTASRRSKPASRKRQALASGTIQSLRRGLHVLDLIAQQGGRLSLTDIARRLNLHFSTAHHLVKTLQAAEYLTQDEVTREYRLSSQLFQVAAVAWNEDELARLGGPLVTALALKSGHTAHLAVLDRRNAIVIRKFDAEGPWRLSDRVGTSRPVYCTALGKVLLAFQSPEVVRQCMAGAHLKALTPNSITSVRRLQSELARVRTRGYAVDDEEYSQGIRCLAAPVFNFSGRLTAALGISGPAWDLTLERMDEFSPVVQEMAERLSRALGFRDPGRRMKSAPRGGRIAPAKERRSRERRS